MASRRFRFAAIRAAALRRSHTATRRKARPLGVVLSASAMSLRRMAAMPARMHPHGIRVEADEDLAGGVARTTPVASQP
jgi:hypothetical protein